MGTLNEDLSAIKEVEDKIIANKVARFAYTDEAYTTNDANGVAEYDVNNAQNIPTADASVLKVNETVLSRGYRAQASSVTRMLLNHFFGRMSYNLNKVNDNVSNLIATLIGHRGTANGFATLDENGRIPYSQLPESAMEYKGQWNAETNTPTLADGTGSKGDFYIVSVGGTQNLGSGNIQFSANDRIIYDGSVWARLSAGAVQTVNNISPENGNVVLTGENIPVSSTDSTLLSAPLTTDRYADSSVTTEKIADNAVTNAKIKEPISVAKGGTGATTANAAANSFINSLELGTAAPKDNDYYVCQWAGGNEETPVNTQYTRRPIAKLWDYIKDKISSVLGLTATQYNGNAKTANKIAVNYTSKTLAVETSAKTKYIKVADCSCGQAGTLQVFLDGGFLVDTLVINFGSGDATEPTLCGRYFGNSRRVWSVIAQKGSNWNSNYSIYVKITQETNCKVNVALLEGDCTINITESTTAPTNISEWKVEYGLFGDLIGNATNAYSGMVHTCSTASETKEKTVSIPGFTLTSGACIRVKFLYGNKAKFPTLNVNNTGAHQILGSRGSLQILIESASDISVQSGLGVCSWDTGIVLDLYYDGANWVVIGDPIVKKFYDGTNALHKNVSLIGNVNASILW